MIKVIDTEKLPIKLWLNDIEDNALGQAKNLANLPFAFKHISIMPDSHSGYGMPIGGVLATLGVVIPNAVGVDIGCGMSIIKTDLQEIDINILKKIMGEIRDKIPVGFSHQIQRQKIDPTVSSEELYEVDIKEFPIVSKEYNDSLYQLGTLGGGNHFIEIQKGNDNYIYIMIHSGSRNLGKKVADYHNKIAINLNEKWYSSVDKSKQLAFLPIDSEEGKTYIKEMNYCVAFAYENRRRMLDTIAGIFKDMIGCDFLPIFDKCKMLNIAHNYAKQEYHFGHNVWVHRKGATLAREGIYGIIPGSQGSKSYIVKGKGNKDSFESCSHGAGRKMGRKDACRRLNLDEEIEKLNSQGIIHGIRTENDLEEATGAYKDIDIVMKNQEDLVDIFVELKPLMIIKG